MAYRQRTVAAVGDLLDGGPNGKWQKMSVGSDGTFLAADSSQSTGLAYKFPAGIAGVSTLSTGLASDVSMPSANTYYDGPSLSLTAGTWLVTAAGFFIGGGTNPTVTAKLWDGTTVYASAEDTHPTGGYAQDVALTAIVSPTSTTTIKLSAACNVASTTMYASAGSNGTGTAQTCTYIRAVQLTGAPASGPGALMPAVRAYNSGNISVPYNTLTALTFDTNRLDQGTSSAQHSTSLNTSRLTAQQAGVYCIMGNIHWAASPGEGELRIRLNGTTYLADNDVVGTASAYAFGMQLSTMYYLNVGDYVELLAYQANPAASGAINVNATGNFSPEFMMARIDSGPGAVQPNTKVQLDYAQTSDISALSATANTWTDFVGNQTFTVDDANSVVEIDVSGLAFSNYSSSSNEVGVRLVIDSTGTAQNKMLCGNYMGNVSGSAFGNILAGASTVTLTGLSAGSHTVKVQVYSSNTANFYCRPVASVNFESLQIRVLERKQSSSPPSSTPAPAVRCYNSADINVNNTTDTILTFNTNVYDQGTSTPQHSTSSNTSRLTCQQAGVYQISATIAFASNSTGYREIYFLLNGTAAISDQEIIPVSASGTEVIHTTQYYLNIGDYVEAVVHQNSGGALNVINTGTYAPVFMMARVDSGGAGFVPIPMVKTSSYAILNSDCLVVAGAGSLTFTLPLASSRAPGMPIVIKNDNFTTTTIARAGSDTIDGATSYSLSSAYASVTLVGDGQSVWRVI